MSKQKKTIKDNKPIKKEQQNNDINTVQEETYDKFTLMPELEEIIKKNPNRNIGCGG